MSFSLPIQPNQALFIVIPAHPSQQAMLDYQRVSAGLNTSLSAAFQNAVSFTQPHPESWKRLTFLSHQITIENHDMSDAAKALLAFQEKESPKKSLKRKVSKIKKMTFKQESMFFPNAAHDTMNEEQIKKHTKDVLQAFKLAYRPNRSFKRLK